MYLISLVICRYYVIMTREKDYNIVIVFIHNNKIYTFFMMVEVGKAKL